ncbi:undecaprenyldiphospho-muramoylpentapeptide beta-N-acetylglucosaminyltransferase [Paenibacillus oenotherae]|uniref:UDP-N-acetylglucosamine--N-acetylmuramyl-(pentapeptide) pyrophosphoryl-undecaprenol N-acetylglucosamine transferase n=1 Tax=Paenibacillus oenotherae TaxID=1435645 RepID=A0ABS7DBC4_9BACL|nr:undecaprenyldiphospho-muramoylpentapeptide beta-N-acetylglucosaminyltransferase [Paenibacillus oenotherae]MBW7477084.1 undecaprenyldiphospho-muramoylpentapeptide beta-N-acetylglucosaminyltransferase [Paenibacillus oenotherae]
MRKIMFTGGGSAGHVTVNIALIPRFLEEGWSVDYIGSEHGIERELVSSIANVAYHPIATGKLRRYMDWQNVKDPFKVMKGVLQAYRLIRRGKPSVIFSKGGFVSVPVVLAAWLNKVPVIIHESDLTPGLANVISIPFAAGVCTTFPETAEHLKRDKCHYVGAIIREEISRGDAERGRAFCGFSERKPVVLIMGGSLGARSINESVRQALPALARQFQIVHLCGKGGIDASISHPGYMQFEYIHEGLQDVLAMSDLVISRAGSNSIFEFLSLSKPMLLIPLSKEQSRGDQLLNARSFEKSGFCEVLYEEQLTGEALVSALKQLYDSRHYYIDNMRKREARDALPAVYELISKAAKKSK